MNHSMWVLGTESLGHLARLDLVLGADLSLNLGLTNLAVSVLLMGIIVACCHAQLSPMGLGK